MNIVPNTFTDSFNGKNVLVTGHSGFKGSWLSTILNQCGAKVHGFSLDRPLNLNHSFFALEVEEFIENPSNQWGEIGQAGVFSSNFDLGKFDFIFHLAAQALVSRSYEEPIFTFQTNAMGSANLMEALRISGFRGTLVVITSDKSYRNDDTGRVFSEEDELGGHDPYSASKGMAEFAIRSYLNSYEVFDSMKVGITRAGNVFGGGDWSSHRLVPDIMRTLLPQGEVVLRSPRSTRPWTYVLDVLRGYLELAIALKGGRVASNEAWNFASGETRTVLQVTEIISKSLNLSPTIIAQEENEVTEPNLLQISSEKSRRALGWSPKLSIEESLAETAEWYQLQHRSFPVKSISHQMIHRSLL
jgi:CDP-glucose 4,6-dehydratase